MVRKASVGDADEVEFVEQQRAINKRRRSSIFGKLATLNFSLVYLMPRQMSYKVVCHKLYGI